jgi:hypothetical protein
VLEDHPLIECWRDARARGAAFDAGKARIALAATGAYNDTITPCVSQLVVGFTLKSDDRDMRPETGPLQTMCQGSIKVASITLSTMATPTPSPAGTPTFDLSILGIAGSDWRIAHCG